MAGTISFSLSQQLDKFGKPLSGGKLYFYQANTVATPQNAYLDSALTLPLPNPIILDEAGRVPQFFLADGSIKIKLLDRDGDVQISADGILVIGASSGGGGGPSVDPTTVFATGDVKQRISSDTVTGWVRINGRTIGSSTSGATERANADTSALYSYIWNNFTDTICPVLSGRGANAAADFSANKQITLFDLKGRALFGFDDMGATTAARLAAGLFVTGNGTTVGSSGGESAHALITAENGPHNHAITDTGHTHGTNTPGGKFLTNAGASPGFAAAGGSAIGDLATGSATTGIILAASGSGTAHNTMPPFALCNWLWKL